MKPRDIHFEGELAFYATTLTYDSILDLHGWEAEKKGIRDAFRSFDFRSMSKAVSDDMIDQIAIAGTPEDCREQFARYEGLLDHILFYPPGLGIKPDRIKENYRMIAEAFGPAN